MQAHSSSIEQGHWLPEAVVEDTILPSAAREFYRKDMGDRKLPGHFSCFSSLVG